MPIESYHFGHIRIDGKDYTSDVILSPSGVDAAWWRREGHRLDVADLAGVLNEPPEVLVVGTGRFGCMDVPKETESALRRRGIDLRIARTGDAVTTYNELAAAHARVVAALHLTC